MSFFLLLLILSEVLLPNLTCASRVRRQATKVRISVIGDTVKLRFLHPDVDTKLEGYILGYGSGLFSKQFIQLPDDGEPYETEIDAEPKYLVAVQPAKDEEVKKQCTGKETLEKPLHLVIGSVTPTSVILSWGTLLNTLSTETNLDDCIEDGHYTVRYREKEPRKKWNYQTCPTTNTVIDQLKPETPYEFGVRAESDDINGAWSRPVIHNTADIDIHKPLNPENILMSKKPVTESPQTFSPSVPEEPTTIIQEPTTPERFQWPKKPITESSQAFSPSLPVLNNVIQSRPASLLRHPAPLPTQRVTEDIPKSLKTTLKPETPMTESPQDFTSSEPLLQSVAQSSPAPTLSHPAPPPTQRVTQATDNHKPVTTEKALRPKEPLTDSPHVFSPSLPGQDTSSVSVTSTSASIETKHVSPVSAPKPLKSPPTYTNTSDKKTQGPYDERLKGQLWEKFTRKEPETNEIKKQENQVEKDGLEDDKITDLKVVEALPIVKPSVASPTAEIQPKPTPSTAPFFAFNGSWYNMGDNSTAFSSNPLSEVDSKGNRRFVGPHVIYKIDKPPEKPCSVTDSLSAFPDEDNVVANISGPPKTPPTNLTVIPVEGCSSFVILDWEKTDNETREYEVTSVISPDGPVVSVVTTNQTHAAVENLKPESSYEFTVTPKNELGSGPSSEAVFFNTESADPRVSAIPTGKNAIWSSFSFQADSYSECTGTQYIKRTWYRKFVGIQLCNSLRYKIYLSDSLKGKFYNIGDETGYGEDHCQFVDSFLDGQTGGPIASNQLPLKQGFFRSMRQEPVKFGKIGGNTQINYVAWYECGVPIPGSW